MLHYTPQHVSSIYVLILRRNENCMCTVSGIVILEKNNRSYVFQCDNTRYCRHTILVPPEDEHIDARNMLRNVV